MTYCPVFLPKTKFCQYSQKTFSKQNLNFSRSALFHMQIRVFLKYFVRTCSNLVGIVFASVALLFYTTSREHFKFLAQRISNFILKPSLSFHSVFFNLLFFNFTNVFWTVVQGNRLNHPMLITVFYCYLNLKMKWSLMRRFLSLNGVS